MKFDRHLFLSEAILPPSSEWTDDTEAWRLVRVSKGAAYWLGTVTRELNEGEIIVVGPANKDCLRASQLGEVRLHYFHFCPETLSGFLTLAERHYFQTAAAMPGTTPRFLPGAHPAARELALLLTETPPTNNLLLRCHLMHVVGLVFVEEMVRHQPPIAKSAAAQSRFKQLINEMPDGDLIKYTPEQLAKLCGCSLRHFSRIFHQHFGIGIRVKQTELRLLKARQLLTNTDAKIIHVALESGYRHLGLFNSMFKKYLGMTPSEWRSKNLRRSRPQKLARVAGLWLAALWTVFSLLAGQEPVVAAQDKETNAPPQAGPLPPEGRAVKPAQNPAANPTATTNAPAAPSTNVVTFPVEAYEITGNTLLRYEDLEPIFKKYVGPAITFEKLRDALGEMTMAYRTRGFVTVGVAVPEQVFSKTNSNLVKIKVTEGRLVEINILNNRHFSSNNIMRALPSLSTNVLLNSLVFQRDLDRANQNRDRQIYANIDPGPDPGTSVLNLKVKDRLPLHGRMELNDYSTPGTPDLRLNAAAQYNNLWQLEHQLGVQYSFSPEAMKQESQWPAFYDQPLVANYSAFYRMPLDYGKGKERGRSYSVSDFGYDEVTKRFRAPPSSDFADLIFYASRSFSDTGLNVQSETITQPADFDTHGGLQIVDQVLAQTLTRNENLGTRISGPLPSFTGLRSSFSAGLDYKSFREQSLQIEKFEASLVLPVFGDTGPPFTIIPAAAPPPTQRETSLSVQYVPFSIAWDASKADKWGTTAFNLNSSFNFSSFFNSQDHFRAAAFSRKGDGNYIILQPGLTREQKLFGDWGVRLHGDGQWANQPLISNEQFGLGGQAGVRGYRDGQEYGDTGWRTTVEPHTPLWKIGMVDATMPMYIRFSIFNDYGHRYLLDPLPGRAQDLGLWGTGFGINGVIGERMDFRFTLGYPLLEIPGSSYGQSAC